MVATSSSKNSRAGPEPALSPVAPRPGEGLLTEPIAGAEPGRQELVFMPHTCRSRYPSGSAQLVGSCHSVPAIDWPRCASVETSMPNEVCERREGGWLRIE